jgi:ketopantoate reductase
MNSNGESRLSYLLAGLGLGAIGALLSAALARKETRERLLEQGSKSLDFLNQQGKKLRESAAVAIDKGKEIMSHRCCSAASSAEAEKQAQPQEDITETLTT